MIAATLAALLLGLPQHAVVVPGKSFAGLKLGATGQQIKAAWGPRYGVCRGCLRPTWFFTYKPFEPQGAAVSFRRGQRRELLHAARTGRLAHGPRPEDR